MTQIPDSNVWMVLGVDREGLGHVAVVVGAEDEKRACMEYQRSHPGCTPVSWPSLRDLRQSTAAMEISVSTGKNEFCPVIVVGAEDHPDAPGQGSVPCPVAVVRVLEEIRASLDEHGFEDPFENNGAAFTSHAFVARAQRWDDDGAPGTLHWRGILVTWHKHLNRETRVNRVPSKQELADLRDECLAAIELEAMARAKPV